MASIQMLIPQRTILIQRFGLPRHGSHINRQRTSECITIKEQTDIQIVQNCTFLFLFMINWRLAYFFMYMYLHVCVCACMDMYVCMYKRIRIKVHAIISKCAPW